MGKKISSSLWLNTKEKTALTAVATATTSLPSSNELLCHLTPRLQLANRDTATLSLPTLYFFFSCFATTIIIQWQIGNDTHCLNVSNVAHSCTCVITFFFVFDWGCKKNLAPYFYRDVWVGGSTALVDTLSDSPLLFYVLTVPVGSAGEVEETPGYTSRYKDNEIKDSRDERESLGAKRYPC